MDKFTTSPCVNKSHSSIPVGMTAYRLLWMCFVWANLSVDVDSYILLGNANVYTMEPENPTAEAIAMENGKILGVGTVEGLRESLQEETEFWDLEGRLVLPGFIDSHLHVVEAGINARICFIDEDADPYDYEFYFQDCPDGGRFGDQGWIVGNGVDVAILVETVEDFNYETPRQILDRAFPDTPVLILDNIGHGAVVNTKAMEDAGYLVFFDQAPPGGKLDRDENGEPTGVLRENAQQAFRNKVFPPTNANNELAYQSLLNAMETLAKNGITSVSDAGGFWKQAQTEAWSKAESEGTLKVRASNALYVYPEVSFVDQIATFQERYSNNKEKLVRFNVAKIYVDGILSLKTSALKEPYSDAARVPVEDELGFLYFGTEGTLQTVANSLVTSGFQLHMHVTGDRGAEIALNIIENLPNNNTGPHRLTHCYLVDETDRSRFQQLNAIADFQLAASSLDSAYESFISSNILGPIRAAELLPAREVYEAGGTVTLSSDWDADDLSPLVKLKGVLTRSNNRGIPDLETALPMLTINAAKSLQHEEFSGSIKTGKFADLVILSDNIFDMRSQDIDQAEVLATIMNGERTFDPDGLFGEPIGTRSAASPVFGRMATFVLVGILVTLVALVSI